jgi:hypothetical protein
MGFAKESVPPSDPGSPAPGPGTSLPAHSEPRKTDLSTLQQKAIAFSGGIQGVAEELFTFFAILALIWTGYHAQFRGLQDFVGTLLRIVFASALIVHYRDLIPVVFDAKNALMSQLALTELDIGTQLSAAMASLGSTVTIMSFTGVAAGVALFGLIVLAIVIYSTQLLFQAVLIGFGPLAIATLAFHHSRGIFTMWVKTFIAVVLIPIGWRLGAKFFSSISGVESITDLLATIVYIAGFAAVYIGMPFITVFLVNSASGSMAMAMPSLTSAAQSFLGSAGSALGSRIPGSSMAGAAAGGAPMPPAAVTAGAGSVTSTVLSTTSSMPSSSAARPPDSMSQRAMAAQQWHKQVQPQLQKS